jgi:photosystem II stability/assembly factor-like uncharacterized protein
MSRWPRLLLITTSLLTLWIASDARQANAQGIPVGWSQWDGPAGRITQLAAAPGDTVLYAVSVTGGNRRDDQTQWFDTGRVQQAEALYRSNDGGRTWAAATNDLPPGALTDLFVEPQTGDLLVGFVGRGAGADRAGLWRQSQENGGWQQVDLGRQGMMVRSITRSADGRRLVLGLTETGETAASYVSRSSDGGATWQTAEVLPFDPSGEGALVSLIAHPADPQRFFMTTQTGGVLVSADGGLTWTQVVASVDSREFYGPVLLGIRPDRSDMALLGQNTETGLALLRSGDGGRSWSPLRGTGLPQGARGQSLLALNGGALLLNTDLGTYRSVNDGGSWQPLEGALSSGGVSEFMALPGGNGQTTVFAATGYGVFASRDSGAIWQEMNSGLPTNSKIFGLLTHRDRPGQVFSISDNRLGWGAADPPLLLVSADAGQRWMPAAAGLPDEQLTAWSMDPANPDRLWVASSTAVYRSSDAGLSWQATRVPSSPRTSMAVSADGTTIYLAGNPPMRSTDGGDSWTQTVVRTSDQVEVQTVTGFALDPGTARHIWAASEAGLFESRDGGDSWAAAGLEGRSLRWVGAVGSEGANETAPSVRLYAGVTGDGLYRREGAQAWQTAATGMPDQSTVLAFAAGPGEALWLTTDGGGIYRSSDWGDTWQNAGSGAGDNLGQALAADYGGGGVLLGTATAGIWLSGSRAPAPLTSPTREPTDSVRQAGPGLDARIEVVWPHSFAPVQEAKLANIAVRLFVPGSLRPPACGWRPRVTLWQAVGTNPAAPLKEAGQRTIDEQPFPYWDINDIDVSAANDPNQKLYFLVKVEEIRTATSVWAHGADARTFFPVQDAPSGIAAGRIDEVDARIQIVWPHDAAGNERPVAEATLANVVVAFFKHGTRLSVPQTWQPSGLVLEGAWNQEVARPLSMEPTLQVRQSGAITYPVWEFNNIAVSRARDGVSKLYLWATTESVRTYPSIWAHGSDSRTFFPEQDEPIQGCSP